jgi:hypothetical protein
MRDRPLIVFAASAAVVAFHAIADAFLWQERGTAWNDHLVPGLANGAHGVRADVAVGAGFPHLGWMGLGAFGTGLLLVGIAGGCFYLAVGRRAR